MGTPVKNVIINTTYGPITVELFHDKAPLTVENFLRYMNDGFYKNTLFHRVIDDFIIQGGGFQAGMVQKTTRAPIKNEAENGVRNDRGTIAMARLPDDPHSATAQFFINTKDNPFLDYKESTKDGWGYCVFGRVVEGMEIVERIQGVPTVTRGEHQNVPLRDVVIQSIEAAPA
jgi:peptidyl-prolyl cis-trans isomerase B (cyclophilin B)